MSDSYPVEENMMAGVVSLEQMIIELGARTNRCQLIQWGNDDDHWECVVVHKKGDAHRIYTASTPMGAVVQAYRDR